MKRFTYQGGRTFQAAAFVALAALSQLACSTSTAPVIRDGVIASSMSDKVTVTNARTKPVFVFAIGRNAAAVVDWRPCVSERECPPIAAGDSREYVINPLTSSYHETEALVYWWQAVTRNGVLEPDSVRFMVVPLK